MTSDRLNTDAGTRRPSRNIAVPATGMLLSVLLSATAAAQAIPPDSLAVRLRRAEAAIATLQTQIAEQAQGSVQTRSRASMAINGRVMLNAFGNTHRVNNVDNPQFVVDLPAPGRGGGMSMRQSRLGIVIAVPEALGGSFTGDLDVDFYGGQQPSGGGRTFPLVRMRTARATVRWSNAHLVIGQESPLISGLNPLTPAAIGTPAFATAGNLWLWLPQTRFGIERSGIIRFGAQAAILAPTSGDPVGPFDTDHDAAERSQRPYLQGRVSASWGDETPGEVGCGVHQGWLIPLTERVNANAFACDALVPVREWLEIRGEFFTGRALRGLGGGGIGQNFEAATLDPLRTTGAWAQVNLQPQMGLRVGAGCGGDHPEALAARRRNDQCAGYAMVRPGPLFFGAEFRRLRTEYSNRRLTNDHVTLAAGFEF